jgi:hypothetical protein
LAHLRRWLSRPAAPGWVIVLAVVLVLPCLTVGFSADDHILRVVFVPDISLAGFERDVLDAFTFARGQAEENATLREQGIFSWWIADDLELDFFRPVTALTHVVDFRLWSESSTAMYAHSIAWFAMLSIAAAAFYRRFGRPAHKPWIAVLALAFFALDDARGPVVGWISNRNALVMGTGVVVSLWAYRRWRVDGWSPGRVLAPAALLFALFAGEAAVGAYGYFVAYAVCLETGPWRRRVAGLLPVVAVGVLWATFYVVEGRGTAGSGVYLDPVAEPVAFLQRAWVRVPVLLMGQFAGPWSDFWPAYPAEVAGGVFVVGVIVLAGVVAALWPTLRADAVARFYALGAALAVVPVAGTFPADRLLTLVGLGGAGLMAAAIGRFLEEGDRGWRRVALGGLLVIHGVVGPLLLPLRARSMDGPNRSLAVLDRAVPDTPNVASKTVVVVAAPSDGLVSYLPFIRASQRRPAPHRLRLLASSMDGVTVERASARTLVLRPDDGFLAEMGDQMLRGPSRPFRRGQVIATSDLTVEILDVLPDGRAAAASFTFDVSLDDASLAWLHWDVDHFAPWPPPPVGARSRLDPVDVTQLARIMLESPSLD